MTGIPEFQDLRQGEPGLSFQQLLGRTVMSASEGVNSRNLPGGEHAWWQSALWGAAKPEEWTTKLIGNIFSNDPKYDWGSDSNFWDQVGFFELFRDTGMNPVASAVLGLGVAIANPLDPLGKMRIARLSKEGLIGREVARSAKLDAITKVKPGFTQGFRKGQLPDSTLEAGFGKSVSVLDSSQLQKQIDDYQSLLQRGNLNAKEAKRVNKSIKNLSKQKQIRDSMNEDLIKLQSAGMKLEDIALAPTHAQQVLRGQRHLLGWSSPLKADQLSLFGIHKAEMDAAPVFDLAGLFGLVPLKARAKVTEFLDATKTTAQTQGLKAAQYVAAKAGFPIQKTDKVRKASEALRSIVQEFHGDQSLLEDDLLNWVVRAEKAGLDDNDWLGIVNALEDVSDEVKLNIKHGLDEFIRLRDANPAQFSKLVAKKVKEVPEETDLIEKGIVPGSRMSDDQVAMQTPSGLTSLEAQEAASFDGLSPKYITRPAKEFDRELFKGLKGVRGLSLFRQQGDKVVARRLGGASPIQVDKTGKATNFNETHLDHLTGFLKDLGLKKRTLSRLHPSDFLVQPTGGIQLTNPAVLVAKGKQQAALDVSRVLIDEFAKKHTFIPEMLGRYRWLDSVKNARQAPKNYGFRTNKFLKGTDSIVNIHDLMEQAPNMRRHRDALESLDMTQEEFEAYIKGVDGLSSPEQEFLALQRQMEATQTPHVKAIEVQLDPKTGFVDVLEGRSRLAALKMLGADYAPIKVRTFADDARNVNSAYYVGNTHRLGEWFDLDNRPRGVQREVSKGGAKKVTVEEPMVSKNYKVFTDKGKFVELDALGMELNSKHLVSQAFNEVLGVGLSPQSKKHRPLVSRTMLTSKGFPTPEALIADLAESSDSVQDFVTQLRPLLVSAKGKPFYLNNVARHGAEAEQLFLQKLKAASSSYLDDLADHGYLTERGLDLPARVSRASANHTILALRPAKNQLMFASSTKTVDELHDFAKAEFSKYSAVEDIDPSGSVLLRGSDDSSSLRMRDFFEDGKASVIDAYDTTPTFRVDDGRIKEWRQNGNIYNANQETLEGWGLTRGVFLGRARVLSDGTTHRTHRKIPFLFFKDANYIISNRHTTIPDLLDSVFKEGSRYHVETGFIDGGRIVLQDVDGSLVNALGKADLRFLESRIHTLAKKLLDMGMNPSNKLEIRMPFDDSVWRRMYGDKTTLGDIVKEGKRFKLQVPEELRGAVIYTDLLNENRVFSIHNKRFDSKNNVAREIYHWIRNKNDELFEKEVINSLNNTFLNGYFPRIVTPQGRMALETVNEIAKDMQSQSKTFKTFEAFMRERTFTDLTTPEVNAFFRMVKDIRSDLKDAPEMWVSEIMDRAKKNFRAGTSGRATDLNVKAEEAERFLAISEELGGAEFFHLQPLMAIRERALASLRARKAVDLLDEFHESGAGVLMSMDEVENAEKLTLNLEKAEKAYLKTVEKHAQAQAKLDAARQAIPSADDQIQLLEAEVKAKTLARAQAKIKVEDLKKMKMDKAGSAAYDISFKNQRVYMTRGAAQSMIERGLIDVKDLPFGLDSQMVAVPLNKYKGLLQKTKTKVLLVNEDGESLMRRYFGVSRNEGEGGFANFVKFWDYLHDTWRTWTLFPIPAYHVRNMLSSANMLWLGGVTDVTAFEDATKILSILRKKKSGSLSLVDANKLLDQVAIAGNGQVYTGRQLLEEFHKRGGTHGGFYYNEYSRFGNVQRLSQFERKMRKEGVTSISTAVDNFRLDNVGLRLGFKTGLFVESHARLAAFLHYSKQGGFSEGERMMKAILYDYSNLSVAERDGLRRVIPFYSWARQNTPRMLETLLLDPVKHVRFARFARSIQQGALDRQPPDEEGIPEYMKDNFGIIINKDKDGNYFMKSLAGIFPVYDVLRMFDTDVMKSLSHTFGVSPFIRFPIEQLTDHSFFFNAPIETDLPSRRPFTIGALGGTRGVSVSGPLGPINMVMNDSFIRDFFRVGNVASNLIDDLLNPKHHIDGQFDARVALVDLLLGRGKVVDPDAVKAAMAFKSAKRVGQLKAIIKQYEEAGNKDYANRVRNLLVDHVLNYGGSK